MCTTDKKELRRTLLSLRRAIGEEEKRLLDGALCKKITTHRYFNEADALLAYLPMRGEPDLTPILEIAAARGIPVFLPRCDENGMRFLLFEGNDRLVKDRFGILSPRVGAREVAPTKKTLCIVPGLAAGRDGSRLGYGGGFYDRFLPRFGGSLLFAVYERLVFDTLPHEPHDCLIPPSDIITEKGETTYADPHSGAPKL